MVNATLTLSVPEKLKKEIRAMPEVNWSEETRRFLEDRVERLKALRKLDELTKNSRLTEEDAIRIGRQIRKGVAEKTLK
ncbi:MAG: hypothetical protein HY394_02860 [Candidatus Diapherotrites archaeon]|nr:hypothetical protein [Candidatus Diapherotrites archaeon]